MRHSDRLLPPMTVPWLDEPWRGTSVTDADVPLPGAQALDGPQDAAATRGITLALPAVVGTRAPIMESEEEMRMEMIDDTVAHLQSLIKLLLRAAVSVFCFWPKFDLNPGFFDLV